MLLCGGRFVVLLCHSPSVPISNVVLVLAVAVAVVVVGLSLWWLLLALLTTRMKWTMAYIDFKAATGRVEAMSIKINDL